MAESKGGVVGALVGIASAVVGALTGSPSTQPQDTGTGYLKHQAREERTRQEREGSRGGGGAKQSQG